MTSTVSARAATARYLLLSGVAAAGLAIPAAAHAQDPAQDVDAAQDVQEQVDLDGDEYPVAEDSGSGNLIIVTATKREQTLQDIPVAVSVTTAETLERAQIRDLSDLQSVVPSLRVTQLQSSANTNFIIRGFGNGANNAGIEPSVGVFVDGVYRSRTASQISDLPDVQRVEVLRGPQSTLFGKNASVGVISIVTKEPAFDFGGLAEVSYGNYNAIVAKGYVTGPVTETVALSLAGGVNMRDGYIRDAATGNRTNERDRWFVRGQALVENGGPFRARFIADYDKIDENCCGVVNVQRSGATQIINALGGQVNLPQDRFDDVVFNNFDSTNDIENYGVSGELNYEFGDTASLTSITAYRRTKSLTDQDSDFTSADLIGTNFADLRLETFTQELRLNLEFAERVNLLIGGYYFDEKVKQNGTIQFGTQFRPYADQLIRAASGGTLNAVALEQQIGLLTTGNPAFYSGRFFAAGQGLFENYRLDNRAYSVFANLDVDITNDLTLTLGGNYTKDKKDAFIDVNSTDVFSGLNLPAIRTAATNAGISQTIGGILGVPGGFASPAQIAGFAGAQPAAFAQIQAGAAAATAPLLGLRALQFLPPFLDVPNAIEDGRTRDDDFSWTARLAWDVTDTLNAYLSYAPGFKASSFNLSRDSRPLSSDLPAILAAGIAPTNLSTGSRFAGPEQSKVFELGLKANWQYASANLTFFDQTLEGFQSNIFTGTGFGLANAGERSTFGVEFDGVVNPTRALTLSLAMTYLNSKFDDFPNSSIGDLSGFQVAGVPEISATFGAQYDLEFANANRLVLRGDYHYESPTQVVDGLPGFLSAGGQAAAIAAARPFRRQVDDLNASITYIFNNGLEVGVWGRNLLDDRYLLSLFDSVAQSGSISSYPNQPRTYGGTVRFRF